MLVKSIMVSKENLTTVTPDVSVKEALELLNEKGYLSLPVVDGHKFYGAISKEKIYSFYFEKEEEKKTILEDFTVEQLIRKDIPTIEAWKEVENAVVLLESQKIPFVAVVDEFAEFKGILTHKAVFQQFTQVFGINKGKRLAVIAFDVPGQISKLSRILTENNADIISFVAVDPESVTEVKEIVVRMKTDKIDKIEEEVKAAGFKII